MRWALFLASFVALYGLILTGVFWRVRPLLSPRGRHWAFAAGLFLLVGPILQRLVQAQGWSLGANILAWASYLGMGWVIMALWMSGLTGLGQLALWLWAKVARPAWSPPSPRFWALVTLVGACALGAHGFWEARHPVLEQVTLSSPKLPASHSPLRIALITDTHLGELAGPSRLAVIKHMLDKHAPHILLAAGDILDGPPEPAQDSLEFLANWRFPLGKFAVLGNHEFHGNPVKAQAFLEKAGFVVLRNQGLTVGGFLNLAGVDDPRGDRMVPDAAALKNLPLGNLTIMMKHRPLVDESTRPGFDLQVSGHTHKGQISPFFLVVRQVHPHIAGLYPLPGGSWLYTSRGAGTWGPPLRLLAPPEVTIITVLSKP